MVRSLLGATFMACIAMGSPALANDFTDCNSVAPDLAVRGCTALLQHHVLSEKAFSAVYMLKGNAESRMRQFEKAAADFNEAIRQNPQNAEAFYSRGLARMEQAFYAKTKDGLTEAIADISTAITIKPTVNYYIARGVARIRNGDADGSIVDETKAIDMQPKSALAYFDRSIALAAKHNFTAALGDVIQSIDLNPQYEQSYYKQAIYLDGLNLYAQALAPLGEAIRLNPGDWQPYSERGRIMLALNRPDEAITDLTMSIGLHPYANVYSNRGIAYLRKLLPDLALKDLDMAIKMDSKNGLSFYYRALAHAMKSNFGAASDDVDQAVILRPMNGQTLYVRSLIRSALHKDNMAKNDYDAAIQLDQTLEKVAVPPEKRIEYFAEWPFFKKTADVQ